MPARVPRACRQHGCPKTTVSPSGYCTAHQGAGWENYQQGRSRHQRGYGSRWDKLRPLVLNRDKYLCQQCLRSGRLTTATAVDHIRAKAHGGTDDLSNLESICTDCHKAKTARERLGESGHFA